MFTSLGCYQNVITSDWKTGVFSFAFRDSDLVETSGFGYLYL